MQISFRRILVSLSISSVLASSGVAAELSEAEKLTRRIMPAVVYVQVVVTVKPVLNSESGPQRFEDIAVGAEGTGFIYHPDGYVITSGRILAELYEPPNNQTARLRQAVLERDIYPRYERQMSRALTYAQRRQIDITVGDALQIQPERKLYVALSNWTFLPAEVRKYSPAIDRGGKEIALLKIDGRNLPTVPVGDSDTVRLQDPVLVLAYPAAAGRGNVPLSRQPLEPTATRGQVSALKADLNGTSVLQIDANVVKASSGGPAFNSKGEVIGIGTLGGADAKTTGINFLIPVNTASMFIRETGIAPASGQFDRLWSEALDLYDNKKFKSSLVKCDEILRIMEKQPDVLRLARDAQDKRNAGGMAVFMEDWGWALYLLGAGILVVAVGLIIVSRFGKPGKKMSAAKGTAATMAAGAQQPVPPVQPLAAPEPAKAYGSLLCSGGEHVGKKFVLDRKGLLIGRDMSKCQIVLQSDLASKEHAWIVPLDEGVFVIDNGSSNGTYVNSVETPRISKLQLKHGDRIIIGKNATAIFTYQSS